VDREHKGFTLVEVLIVVLVISMLAAFVAPRFFRGLGRTRRDIARSKMAIIESGLGLFYRDCGRYPDDSEGLDVLIYAPEDAEDKWNGPYLKQSDLLDPWDNRYEYVEDGEINPGLFDLISYGADGQEGGEGDDADIYNE